MNARKREIDVKRSGNALVLFLALLVLAGVAWGVFCFRSVTVVAPAPSLPAPSNLRPAGPAFAVLDVIDGDTIAIEIDGAREKVRLKGIDTPESVHPSKPVERFGPEASQFLRELLAGESVHLVLEPGAPIHDKYDRVLGYLFRASDGLFINAEILRRGYGRAYTRFPFGYEEQFLALEAEARSAGRGMWGRVGGAPSAPRELQHRTPTTLRPRQEVYATPSGRKYHARGCRHVGDGSRALTIEAATAEGLEPCSVCEP